MTRTELLARGWSSAAIQHRVRTGAWIRTSRGTYLTARRSESTHSELRAALTAHGPDAVAVLHSAARLHGIAGVWPADPRSHIARAPGQERHQQSGIVVHTWKLRPGDVVTIDGIRVTDPGRTVSDLMRRLDRFAAVSVLDSALHQGLLSKHDLDSLDHAARGLRGALRCRPWWRLGDGRAESPLETRVRLIAIDAGYPPDDLQVPVRVDGVVVARADLAWWRPDGRLLVAEADGAAYHDVPEALLHDRRRQNLIAAADQVDLVRFTWNDSLPGRDSIPATLHRFLGPPRSRRS